MRKFSKIESELLLKEELTVGIDEVGIGSLIGPVVACAFQLDSIIKNIELNDSKMLSENKRISKVLELLINNSKLPKKLLRLRSNFTLDKQLEISCITLLLLFFLLLINFFPLNMKIKY